MADIAERLTREAEALNRIAASAPDQLQSAAALRDLLQAAVAEIERLRTLASTQTLDGACVAEMRSIAHEGLGFNATWVDDDMRLVICLAQRAVLAGLDADAQPDIRRRFKEAAERYRDGHEAALGFPVPILPAKEPRP